MDPGPWIQDQESGVQYPGSRILDPGFQDPGECRILGPGSRILDPGFLDPGTTILDLVSWILAAVPMQKPTCFAKSTL